MKNIRNFRWTATIPAGDTGATAYSPPIRGKILKVGVNYNTAACTVDLDTDGEPSAQKVLDLASGSTDATYYPRKAVEDITGTAVTYDGTNEIYEPFVVYGRLLLTLASGTATHSVTVHVTVEE